MKLSGFQALSILAVTAVLAGCGGRYNPDLAKACSEGIDVGFAELQDAETRGLSGSVQLTKAGSLLGAAKVQYEFEHYPNCINKVRRAREYIKRAGGA